MTKPLQGSIDFQIRVLHFKKFVDDRNWEIGINVISGAINNIMESVNNDR